MNCTIVAAQSQLIREEIVDLESRLQDAKERLNSIEGAVAPFPSLPNEGPISASSHHFLFLLADSALPLGSFAFSSGLESYLAHTSPTPSFPHFLTLSLSSYASTNLPFVLAAHINPLDILALDDAQDATIMCPVARRASVAQGRALLSIWDRSFSPVASAASSPSSAVQALKVFSTILRSSSGSGTASELPPASAHIAPLFGAVACILGLSLKQTAYVFVLSHVKALLSAAVRAGRFGPYHAQKVLASLEVQAGIHEVLEREWGIRIEDAGQTVPVMDLWIGRHEMLYSRIFNS
ncbi:hypothetical protein BJ878DRAFT_413176 [Calycina marina]|uniref:Urease accessory protein UreF n=1 Tax=Calycina marina TaxID=1763456 RepID=A0A9P8CIC0_9HELO|nr:hypothetical protein BJ878DRAFT_413176 [Calycina marina]